MQNPPYFFKKRFIEHGYRAHHRMDVWMSVKTHFDFNNNLVLNITGAAAMVYFGWLSIRCLGFEHDPELGPVGDSSNSFILWLISMAFLAFLTDAVSHMFRDISSEINLLLVKINDTVSNTLFCVVFACYSFVLFNDDKSLQIAAFFLLIALLNIIHFWAYEFMGLKRS